MAKKKYTEEQLTQPMEPQGILSKAKSVGLSGLAYAGNLLGTPGAMVKNALGGKNPLTPLLHPLSGEGRLEGRDLLRQHGLVGNKNTWGNWAAGLGVDIVTDPLMYVNPLGAMTKLGAVTAAGKAAHAIGALDDVTKVATQIGRRSGKLGATETASRASARARTTLRDVMDYGDEVQKANRARALEAYGAKTGQNVADLMDKPLGGVMNAWAPFLGTHTIGASEQGAQFLEGVGKAAGAIPGAKTVGKVADATKRLYGGMFQGKNLGLFGKYEQEIASLHTEKMAPRNRELVTRMMDLTDELGKLQEAASPLAAGNHVPGPLSGKFPYDVNDLVKAADRGNFGYVVGLDEKGAQVHFTNPETLATSTVHIPHDKLARASATELPDELRHLHSPAGRVVDRMLRMTIETKGDLDRVANEFTQGRPIPPHLQEQFGKLARDMVEYKDFVRNSNDDLGLRSPKLADWEGGAPGATAASGPPPAGGPPVPAPAPVVPPGKVAEKASKTPQQVAKIVDSVIGGQDDLAKKLESLEAAGAPEEEIQAVYQQLQDQQARPAWGGAPAPAAAAQAPQQLDQSMPLRPDEISDMAQKMWDSPDSVMDVGQGMILKKSGRHIALSRGDDMATASFVKGDGVVELSIPLPKSRQTNEAVDLYEVMLLQLGSQGVPSVSMRMATAGQLEGVRKLASRGYDVIENPANTANSIGDAIAPSGQYAVTIRTGKTPSGAQSPGFSEPKQAASQAAAPSAASQPPAAHPAPPAAPPGPTGINPFEHFGRYRTERGAQEGALKTHKLMPVGSPSNYARNELTSHLPTEYANRLGTEAKYRTPDAAAHILKDFQGYLGWMDEGNWIPPEVHAQQLAEHAKGLDKEWVEKSKRLFDNMTVEDLRRYMLYEYKRNATGNAIHEAFAMNITQEGARLEDAFKAIGFDSDKAMAHFAKRSGLSGDALANARVPPELANAAAAVIKSFENEEWANVLTKTLDAVNRYVKPGMILVKPAFWFRNHTSGQYSNLVSGYINNVADVYAYMASYGEAFRGWKKGDKALQREVEVMGLMGADSTLEAHDYVFRGAMHPKIHPGMPANPANIPETSKEVWAHMSAKPNPENPILNAAAQATKGVRHKASTWMQTNSKANSLVEFQNRVSMYLYLKKRGFSPEQAAEVVKEIHFDYSRASMAPFERDFMRRVVPFYVYTRNAMPWTMNQLATYPGGSLAQTIKATARAHKTEDLAPEYISETASVPIKTLPDGSKRYLTGLGLGFEDPTSFMTPSLKQVGLEAISRTNPIIKGPLEYAFGQSAFQKGPFGGRALEDLDPVLGRTLANIGQLTGLRNKDSAVRLPKGELIEHAISNSPISGLMTALRTATDPRKGIPTKAANLLTGLRFTDVSPQAMDMEVQRRASQIERSLLGGRSFTRSFVPKDRQAEYTTKEQAMAAELKELRRLLEERKKQRK